MQYCPRCQKLVDTLSSVTERKEKRKNKVVIVTWTSYQCRSCRLTIRSEKREREVQVGKKVSGSTFQVPG